jgi:AcrR family transcriptional regulator
VRPALNHAREKTARPQRADAARNRARVLGAARELFAADGVDVPLDEIARRAGVGAGTVHRHFPTKEALLAAIVVERLERRADEGLRLAADDPAEGLFELLDRLLDDGRENLAVKAALAESGFRLRVAAGDTAGRLDAAFVSLLDSAQQTGTVRADIDLDDLKAALAGALAAQEQAGRERTKVERARAIALAGLRPSPIQ